jgi:hypothetical protein
VVVRVLGVCQGLGCVTRVVLRVFCYVGFNVSTSSLLALRQAAQLALRHAHACTTQPCDVGHFD